jgi:signal peptidase I
MSPAARSWRLRGALIGLAVVVVGGLAGTGLLARSDNRVFVIPSGGMNPTLVVGDRITIDGGARVRDGDIVVFRAPDESYGPRNKGFYVKRVIGVGGETVSCCTHGAVTRDGVALNEPYLASDGVVDSNAAFPTTTVPDGRLWVMGDNRGNSSDSRFHINDAHHGTIAESDVLGRVVAKGSPADAYGYVARRSFLVAIPAGLLVGLVLTLLDRFRRPRLLEGDPVWSPRGTMGGP